MEIVYHAATLDRTRAINQFKALIVTAPDGLRHRLRDGLSLAAQLGRARRFTDKHPDLIEMQTRVRDAHFSRGEFLGEAEGCSPLTETEGV